MTMTRRGKLTAGLVSVAVAATIGIGALVMTGNAAVVGRVFDRVTGRDAPPPPPTCPLTGTPAPGGAIPKRPALAIKIENLPEARPQAGLENADVIYEEPVEGGITRFISIFQCHEAPRVGPVRSGRTTDPDVLRQYGKPLLGYAGGANAVAKAIDRSPVTDLSETKVPGAYERDPNRLAPHNLYTSTKKLYSAGRSKARAPRPVFTYGDVAGKSRKVRTVHLPFSAYSDVYWRWSRADGAWLRSHGTVPHMLEGGVRVSATNVLVQQVKVVPGQIVDAAGNHSPEVSLTGKGKAYLFRNGRMITGKWSRPTLQDQTTFTTRGGDTFVLAPGSTWVELYPNTLPVGTTR